MAQAPLKVRFGTGIAFDPDAPPLSAPPAHLGPVQAVAWADIVANCPEPIPSYYAITVELMAFLITEYRAGKLRSDGLTVLLEMLVLYGYETEGCRGLLEATTSTGEFESTIPTGPRVAVR